jgi:hypothetical protein
MQSSFHRPIPFLTSATANSEDSTQFLCSQAHILVGWRLETRLTLLNWILLYNNFEGTTQKSQPLYYWEGVFTAPLHSNGSYSNVACVFVAAEICLPSRCPTMNVYSDFTILAFGLHVTILFYIKFMLRRNKSCLLLTSLLTELSPSW